MTIDEYKLEWAIEDLRSYGIQFLARMKKAKAALADGDAEGAYCIAFDAVKHINQQTWSPARVELNEAVIMDDEED